MEEGRAQSGPLRILNSVLSYRDGALHVVETPQERDSVVRALRQLDDRLFVEKQVTLRGEEVWCVVCEIGGDLPPVTLMEWRDEYERPISELSHGIVTRMSRMDRDGKRLTARVIQQNQRMVERARSRVDEAYADLARDIVPRIQGRKTSVLPRGVYLRQHRDKLRAKGRRI